ncbi:phosphomevalonate kinase [Anticarsia gemmatalis]|uniref:phosphomevalonate kinase n=1 Tax=Anticarsia gemmatalis TaxID=129554 RepID=UPI001EA95A7B|nr:phosphomevalonate kinase [Anticarsia gemmatalis]
MPRVIALISGKRKSGKDYVSNTLQAYTSGKSEVVKISRPIKTHWAKEKNLDLDELLSDSGYKEQYRLEMIKWSEEIRAKDYGYFCRTACESAKDNVIWIVSDVRRKTDIQWFKETYGSKVRTIRINADEEIRKNRGYVFTPGVDDAPSECDLDDYTEWDLVLNNNNENLERVQQFVNRLVPSLEPVGFVDFPNF